MATTDSLDARSTADDVLRERDLRGQNILVTGCSSGIGLETARSLAAHGAHVLLGVRGAERAEQVAEGIRRAHPEATLTPLELDLASFASIRAAAAAVSVPALHVLICNAGLYANTYGETEDGLERTVGVCHFGHFLLTQLLMDKLRAAAPARVVMVSSEGHRHPSQLDLARCPLTAKQFRPLVAYGQAKLCNVLFAAELDRRFRQEGIRAVSLHPGSMIGTSIFRESMLAKALALALRPFTKSVAQGAATTVYCATAADLEAGGGAYFVDCRQKAPSHGARDKAKALSLWELSEARVA